MSSVITATTGLITNVETVNLKVFKEYTDLRWSAIYKQKDISLLNGGSSAKLTSINSGTKAILANKEYQIDAVKEVWTYKIHQGDVIQVGMAKNTRDLESIDANSDHVFLQLNVLPDTSVKSSLNDNSTLTIEYDGKENIIDMSSFTGQFMRPWISAVGPGAGFSATIVGSRELSIYYDKNGSAVIDTTSGIGIGSSLIIETGGAGLDIGGVPISISDLTATPPNDLSILEGTNRLGIVIKNVTGNLCVTGAEVQVDTVRAKTVGGALTLISQPGLGAIIDISGNLTVSPGNVITSTVQAVASNDLLLLEDTNNLGIEIEDITGDVTMTGSVLKTNALDVTGNIVVSGTVDGIDIATDVAANTLKVGADGSVNTHSDVTITTALDDNILQYDTGAWVNKTIAAAGIAAASHTHTASEVTDFNTAADARITAQKGNANGLAELNGSGKVPASQLSLTNVIYCGTWDAATNTPVLVDGGGTVTQGCYYVVNVAGSTSLDGITDWVVGDWTIFNGTVWEKVDNTDQVTSVAGKQGAVSLVFDGDLTDINITNVADLEILQYDNGTAKWVNRTLAEAGISDQTLDSAYNASAGASTINVDAGNLTWVASGVHNCITNISGTGKWAVQDGGDDILSVTGAGVLTASAPLGVNDIDTTSATTLLLGKTLANKVEISVAGRITEVQGNLEIAQGVSFSSSTTASTNYTMLGTDYVKIFTATGAKTITLPNRATNIGKQYVIINGGTGVATVNRAGADLIDSGATSVALSTIHDRLVIIATSTNWYTI